MDACAYVVLYTDGSICMGDYMCVVLVYTVVDIYV